MEIHDLVDDCCGENVPGFESTLYVVPACDIVTDAVPPAYDSTTPGLSKIITTDIELKPMAKFVTVPIIIDTGGIMSNSVGNTGSKGMRNEFSFQVAGSSAAKLEWADRVKNGCYVVLATDKMGRIRKVGSKLSPALFETIENVNNNEDSKTSYMVYDSYGRTAPIYEGTIDLDDAT